MKRILVVEDDPTIRSNILELLGEEGFVGIAAEDGRQALETALAHPPDLIISDIMMPELDGHGLLGAIRSRTELAALPFIFLTAKDGRSDQRAGMNLGADDYITKPFTRADLLEAIRARLERNETCRVTRQPSRQWFSATVPEEAPVKRPPASDRKIIAGAPSMRELYEQAESVAGVDASVLIIGETGSGKDLLANEIHRMSRRASGLFMALNINTFTDGLMESELFGVEPNAYTGAAKVVRPGPFEAAKGGTVFLDEIGELPVSTQVKLLRVLENRRVRRVGGLVEIPIDVRFIAATNKDLREAVAAGRFRQDLFFRLSGFKLRVPSLKERRPDIAPLARAFVEEACREQRRARIPAISAQALEVLEVYHWPGNVRQLKNVIENAVLFCAGPVIEAESMRKAVRDCSPLAEPAPYPKDHDSAPSQNEPAEPLTARERLERGRDEIERQELVDTLERNNGNQTRAAEELGWSRRKLVDRLGRYNLDRPRKK